jgi:hypothetical protein
MTRPMDHKNNNKEASLFPSLEPRPNLIPNQNLRPADVMLPGFNDQGRSLCVDVTIVGVVSLSHPTSMQSVPDRKNALYLDLCRLHHLDFTPFVMDSYGSFHSSASALLDRIMSVKNMTIPRASTHIYQRLSFALI